MIQTVGKQPREEAEVTKPSFKFFRHLDYKKIRTVGEKLRGEFGDMKPSFKPSKTEMTTFLQTIENRVLAFKKKTNQNRQEVNNERFNRSDISTTRRYEQ